MSVSVLDLVLERVKQRLDDELPTVGASAVFDSVALLVQHRLANQVPADVRAFTERLIRMLDTPLPRILVAGWRSYEEFLPFARAPEGSDARSGRVVLAEYEVRTHWELAPRLHGRPLDGPRLLVGLTLGLDAATVIVRDARFVALEAADLTYSAFLQIKNAPDRLQKVGPRTLQLPGGRLDFGEGWAIRLA
jgi:hypothetical protein